MNIYDEFPRRSDGPESYMDSMALDDRGVYHGDAFCDGRDDFGRLLTFRCPGCERLVCYCGGHDAESARCLAHCDECECDDCAPLAGRRGGT